MTVAAAAMAALQAGAQPRPSPAPAVNAPAAAEFGGPTEVAPPMRLTAGRSALLRLQSDAARVSVGNPDIADVTLINPREVYLLGKKAGSTNVFVWSRNRTTLVDVVVSMDVATLRSRLGELVPSESGVRVDAINDTVVLSGRVGDALKAARLVQLAEAYGGGRKIINMLSVEANQQVMLEVKVAEVSKTLLDRLGSNVDLTRGGEHTFRLLSDFLAGAGGAVSAASGSGRTNLVLDAEINNGLVKILAEPNIMAISGQEGTFLAGGRIYIPVPQTGTGGTTITLEEKEFGVGLRFLPTVLDEGRINLRVAPEVSELSQVGTTLRAGGQVSILPTINTRRASTTVQLRDGESFAIGGLIKNNVTEALKSFPGLGELPVLGALFRSTEFQTDRSELLFIVTPRLVKPLPPNYALPTDSFVEPTRAERYLEGRVEGATPPPAEAPATPAPGFQLK
ncbi:MAG TPA: type II and III secretion system protein family protein [Ramlibacter sp.]|nr:type II and III secretion system protein family protein [Ramlibacter sp.]